MRPSRSPSPFRVACPGGGTRLAGRTQASLLALAGLLAWPLATHGRALIQPGVDATLWHALGAIAPLAFWGLPLASVVLAVVSALPRPERDAGRGEARDASWLDRLSLSPSSQDEAE